MLGVAGNVIYDVYYAVLEDVCLSLRFGLGVRKSLSDVMLAVNLIAAIRRYLILGTSGNVVSIGKSAK
jgi:hypothetical protein